MIDASMYNRRAVIPNVNDVFDAYGQQKTLQDLAKVRKMELTQLQDQEATRTAEKQKQKTLKGLLEINTDVSKDGKVSINPRYGADLARMGMTQEALGFQEKQASGEKAAKDAQAAKVIKLLGTRKDILSRVRPGSLSDYQSAMATLKAAGDDLDGIPTLQEFTRDPGSMQRHFQEVLTEKEKWERESKGKDQAHQGAQLAETVRNNKANNQLAKDRIAAEAAKPKGMDSGLPQDSKTQINVLATKTAGKKAIANQLKSDLVQLRGALGLDPTGKPIPGAKRNEELAVRYGQSMLKTMNSKEGADAVGVDEAKRSADGLEYNIADVSAMLGFKPGKFHGRDMDGFASQVGSIVDGISGSINANQGEIDRLYGRTNPPAAPSFPGGGALKPNQDGSFDYIPGGQ